MKDPNKSPTPSASVEQIKAVINAFLNERLEGKLAKLRPEEDEKRRALQEEHLPENWIANAAKRVAQIQQVTHALKFTHPEARGTNLASSGNSEAGDEIIGTHTLGPDLTPDVVGNAAALDVYKFLRLSVEGYTLLDLANAADPALANAFSDDVTLGSAWMASFASVSEAKGPPAASKLAKQVFWPLERANYHLLAPLFPSSLVHSVWKQIQEDRFSDAAKMARNARRSGLAHPNGYREYPGLTIHNFGGTKPQNISQLNSERRGENYLLPSVPPAWESREVHAPFWTSSVFDRVFGSRKRVRELVRTLNEFLESVEHTRSNIRIRKKRADLAGLIRDEALQYAAELRQLEPGWSASPECRLNSAEQCWLDPRRAERDVDFRKLMQQGSWQDEISRRFGNWLNTRLSSPSFAMGAVEAAHWQEVLEQELRFMRDEVTGDE